MKVVCAPVIWSPTLFTLTWTPCILLSTPFTLSPTSSALLSMPCAAFRSFPPASSEKSLEKQSAKRDVTCRQGSTHSHHSDLTHLSRWKDEKYFDHDFHKYICHVGGPWDVDIGFESSKEVLHLLKEFNDCALASLNTLDSPRYLGLQEYRKMAEK